MGKDSEKMENNENREVIYDIRGFDDPINGYVIDMTDEAEVANSSEEARINFISKCASISRGKEESSNPEVRYKHLLKEGAMNSCSRPMEFCPVYINFEIFGNRVVLHLKDNRQYNMALDRFLNTITKFGFIEQIILSNGGDLPALNCCHIKQNRRKPENRHRQTYIGYTL